MMKHKKIICFILTIILTALMLGLPVLAGDVKGIYGSKITPDTGLSNIGKPVIAIIRSVAVVCAVVATVVIGIKYVYSAPGEKAEIKKKMMPWAIGLVLIFAAVGLVNLAFTITGGLF